jgi:hypothetical protein
MSGKGEAVGVGVGCAYLLMTALAAGEVFGIVWAIVQLCAPGHPWLILDIVLLVLLVPGFLLAGRVGRKR